MIFLWPRKTVSVSVRYLFYQRSKHGLFVFPNACREDTVRLANRISVWRQSEVSIDFRKVLRGMKFFHPSIRLTNQKPRAFVFFRRTNQIALFPFVCYFCFVLYSTANDPETANDPHWTANDPRPQVIPKVDRKWSRKKNRNSLDSS